MEEAKVLSNERIKGEVNGLYYELVDINDTDINKVYTHEIYIP